MRALGIHHHGWWRDAPSIRDGGGPTRVVDNGTDDKDFKPRPVGFTAKIEPKGTLDSTPVV